MYAEKAIVAVMMTIIMPVCIFVTAESLQKFFTKRTLHTVAAYSGCTIKYYVVEQVVPKIGYTLRLTKNTLAVCMDARAGYVVDRHIFQYVDNHVKAVDARQFSDCHGK